MEVSKKIKKNQAKNGKRKIVEHKASDHVKKIEKIKTKKTDVKTKEKKK